jgi:hypothetical protein
MHNLKTWFQDSFNRFQSRVARDSSNGEVLNELDDTLNHLLNRNLWQAYTNKRMSTYSMFEPQLNAAKS